MSKEITVKNFSSPISGEHKFNGIFFGQIVIHTGMVASKRAHPNHSYAKLLRR